MSLANGYGDDLDEEERLDLEAELAEGFADIEQRFSVDAQQGVENVIVVDNVPIVDESKKQRLVERLKQVFDRAGAGIEEDRFNMPWDAEKGTNKGFIFLTYPDAQQAENALRALDGVQFGKAHTLYVNRFGDIERYANLPVGEGELPTGWKEKSYVEKDHLRSWLGDAAGRDQYVTFRDMDADLWWNGRNGTPEQVRDANGKVVKNPKWADTYLDWSPNGTYLISVHRVGAALWCGPRLDGPIGANVLRFTHPGVRYVGFSPCENYLVTFSEEPITLEQASPAVRSTFSPEDEGAQIVVWDVRAQRVLRTFPMDPPLPSRDGEKPRRAEWPFLKFSPDDKYVAKVQAGVAIQVYELPAMGLLDKKSIKIDGVLDFEWCPMGEQDWEERKQGKGRECLLAYWAPEKENQPARVNVMGIPSRDVVRAKNLINVIDCRFYWQNQGNYLCVKVDRHARKAKTKKATSCNLEIFRLREKNFPIESIELKDPVPMFQWEPYGTRFAIVSSADPNYDQRIPGAVIKYNIDFYQPDPKKGDFTRIAHLDSKLVNTIMWAPKGRHIVLASLNNPTRSDLEFWDMDFTVEDKKDVEPGKNVEMLGSAEHYGVTEISWDASGRYLASVASAWRSSPEPGYIIWDFKGQELQRQQLDRFKQLVWRNRPTSLLPKDLQRKVRRELKEHSRVFDEEDAAEENRGSAEKLAQRQREIAEWDTWRSRNVAKLAEERKRRGLEKQKPVEKEAADEKVEEWIEELIDETEEVVVKPSKA